MERWRDPNCAQAEEICKQNECQLRAIFMATRDGIALVDDELTFTDVNPAGEAIFGLSREQLLGLRIAEFTDSVSGSDGSWGTLLAAGEMSRECRVVRPDGSIRLTEVTATARILPGRHLVVLHDVTDRKQLEEERGLLVAELEAIIDAATDGIVLYGPGGEILRMNPAAEAIFPYPPESRGKPLAERWAWGRKRQASGDVFPVERLPISRVLRGEEAQAELISFERPDGRTIWLMAGAAPVRSPDGRMWGGVGTYTDVTRLHELGEENEIYVHMIAHDLRNPLTVILGHAEMLRPAIREAGLGEIPALNIEAIVNAGQQMGKMMEDLVDLARIQGGQLQLDREPVDLDVFVRSLLERSRVALDVGRVAVDVPAELPAVSADPLALERILVNLLSNALKYSPPGGQVELRARQQNGFVLCTVADRGPGIPPAELPHIFDRFYRARIARHQAGGLGLGLSITRSLVEAHGGRIWAESAAGEGSTFFFSLPMAAPL